MNIGKAIKDGFRLAGHAKRAVLALFIANLALAALAAWPIYRGILRWTGFSLMGHELAKGFSIDWLTDFAVNSPGSFERYAATLSLLGLLAIPVNSILAGGVLARFRDVHLPYSLGDYCHACAHYAWRLIRLLVIGLVCYWIIFRLLNQALGDAVGHWMRNSIDDRHVFWARLAWGILVALALILVNLILDYARVKLVMEDASSALVAFLGALGFSLGRLPKALLVYAVPSLCGLALLGVYRLAVPWSAIHTGLAFGLLFIGQQVTMLLRYWFRAATWASEWAYYQGSRRARAVNVNPPPLG